MSRQPDFSTAPRPSRLRGWERVALGVGVLAVALVALAAARTRSQAGEAATRLVQTRGEVERLSSRRAAVTARRAGPGSAVAASAPTRVVAAIAAALPPDARLERLAIDYAHGTAIEMQVVTRNPSAWDRLLERLERAPELREVAPGPELRQGELRSVVRARWAGGVR